MNPDIVRRHMFGHTTAIFSNTSTVIPNGTTGAPKLTRTRINDDDDDDDDSATEPAPAFLPRYYRGRNRA